MEPQVDLPLPDPEATRALGIRLAAALEPGLVVALVGDLGAGKTALSKAIVATLCDVEEDDVASPTFVLAIEYEGRLPVVHLDAYRLGGAAALRDLDLGLGTRTDRVALVEWADRVEEALPEDRLTVELEHDPPGRRARLRAGGPMSARALAALGG
jgi:tRNA threonylcarbamoyladenosine biosynthesis protein TsaE